MYGVVRGCLVVIEIFECVVKMDKYQWMHDSIISKKFDMNEQNEDEVGGSFWNYCQCFFLWKQYC